MARFTFDQGRVNYNTLTQGGKEYELRLVQRAGTVWTTLTNLLPSNYSASVVSANYTQELKSVALEIARIELALEDVNNDGGYTTTRSDFLWAIIGYLVFLNGQLPALTFDDTSFRSFLLSVIKIYFQGSIPTSMQEGVNLFVSENVTIYENFLLLRSGTSGLDISDEFGFQIDISGGFPPDASNLDANIKLILDIVRPAHTLYKLRYIFEDHFIPNGDQINRILDSYTWELSDYHYEDFRSYWSGIRDRDRLGAKVNQVVVNEDHSSDF